MAVSGLLDARLVRLARLQPHQNLVVAEVARRVQREVLISILVRQAQRDFAVEDQVELAEVLQPLDNGLVGDEYSAVECRDEEGQEFGASFTHDTLVVLVAEHVIEIANHWLEKLFNKLISQSRLELHEELIAIDEFLVIVR